MHSLSGLISLIKVYKHSQNKFKSRMQVKKSVRCLSYINQVIASGKDYKLLMEQSQ